MKRRVVDWLKIVNGAGGFDLDRKGLERRGRRGFTGAADDCDTAILSDALHTTIIPPASWRSGVVDS